MAFISEADAFRRPAEASAPPASTPAAPAKLGNFITEEEATGYSAAPSAFDILGGQARAVTERLSAGARNLARPFSSVLWDAKPAPAFDTDPAANRFYRDRSVSPGSVMFSQTNQADTRAALEKELAGAPPPPPTFLANPRKFVEGMTLGTVGQVSDMFSSIPKSVLGSAVYNYSRLYDELFTKVSRADSVKNAQALKDKWPQELNAPWSVVAKAMGPEALYFYENNPVAFVMGQIGKGIETVASGAGAATGTPVGDIMNLADATMGWLGVAGVKKGVTSSVKARTAQLRGALEPKAPVITGGVEPMFAEGPLAPEAPPAPAAPAPGMGARLRGAVTGLREDWQAASTMGTDAVAAAAEAVAASKARIAAIKPIDLTEAPPAAPTKAELKAQADAVDSLVVDKAKLQEIFGLAAKKGPAAEAALVQNIFDRVLKPTTKVEPLPLAEPRAPYDATTFPPGEGPKTTLAGPPTIIGETVTPDLVTSGLDKLKQGLLISAREAKAIRGLQVRAGEGVIVDQSGKPLFQRGSSDTSLLKVLTLMGLSGIAANQIYDWWNSPSGLSEDKARDVGMGLAAAGAAGVIKGLPRQLSTEVFLKTHPEFTDTVLKTPDGKLIELYHGGKPLENGLPTKGTGIFAEGVYLTQFPKRASGYGNTVYPVFANLKNPITTEAFAERFGQGIKTPAESKQITTQLLSEGYDGVVGKLKDKNWEVVAFNPETQIKSSLSGVTPGEKITAQDAIQREVYDQLAAGSRADLGKMEKGSAKPEQLALIAGGAAAAAYLASDPDPDKLATLATALGAGVIASRGGKFADLPEGKLIETFRAGGREGEAAAAQIWENTNRQLGRTIGNMNRQLDEAGIQDISQRVYEKVFKALKQSPDDPGGFRGDAKLSTFLHGVASNEVKNSFAAASRRPATDSMTVDTEGMTAVPEKYMMEQNPERYQSAEDVTSNNQLAQQMQKALDKLPEDSRALFEAIEMEGLSYQEAADRFGIPIGTVRSRVSRAKDALGQSLRQYRTQGGKIDTDAVIALGALGSGVALGAYLDSDNPIRGGVLGAIGVAGFGAMAKGKPGKGLEYTLGLVSTELGGISQPLLRRARDYERFVMERTDKALDAVTPFIKGIKKLPAAAADALNLALLRNDPGEIAAAIKGNPVLVAGYKQVQNLLAAFRAEQISLSRFAAGVNDYFPRVVKDLEGLKEALNLPMRTQLENALAKAEADMIKARGRGLTDVERSLVVNRSLLASAPNASLPGFAKARGVDVTADLAQFYMTPTESLLRYIVGAVEDAEVAKFFGKDLASKKLANGQMATHVDNSIGNLIQSEMKSGALSAEKQLAIKSVLESRFKAGEQQMGGFLQDVRNATNIGLLGNFASAATQIGDSLMTAYHHNLMPTLGALRMKLTGSSQITPKEFGLVNHIAEEMGSTRITGKALQTLFKYTGFSAIDQFAKGLNLQAGLIKNQQLAQTPKGQAKLAERWGQAFGAEFPQLLADLAAKRISEPVKSLLFSELSNAQPITKLEVPQAYLDHPNGRILYQMKTYMLKQIDIVRRDAYQEIAKGNYVKGARNLVALAAAMSLANIPGDIVKDMLAGRPVQLDKIDYVENILQNFGINHYTMSKIHAETKAKGVVEFAKGTVTPPILSMLSDLDKPERLIKYIPGIGRPLYDREFGGNEARKWAELVQAKRAERDRLEEQSPALKAERLRKAEAIKRKRNEAMQALP